MADIVLYDRTGASVTYSGVETITTDTPTEGKKATFTHGVLMEGAEIDLNMADGDQQLTVPEGYLVREATIKKPETLTPEHIKKGVDVAGVIGTFAGDEMEKTVELDMADGDQIIDADPDTVMTRVTVRKPETLVPENIADGVNIGGVIGKGKKFPAEFVEFSHVYSGYSGDTFALTDDLFTRPPTKIEGIRFSSIDALSAVYLSQLSSISFNTFNSCINLEEINLPNLRGSIFGAFNSLPKLSRLSIPKVEYISSAFEYCSSLTELYLPGCKKIFNAFRSCTKLENIYIPNVYMVDSSAFDGCAKISMLSNSVYYIREDIALKNNSSFLNRSCYLSSGTRVLANSLFDGRYSMISIINTENIEAIGSCAFRSCSKLSILSFPNCISIGRSAFASCISLQTINLPWFSGDNEDVETNGKEAFAYCKKLSSVSIPKLKKVDYSMFNSCIGISKVKFLSCEYIGSSAFKCCSSLESVVLGNVSYIAFAAFWSCWKLITKTSHTPNGLRTLKIQYFS